MLNSNKMALSDVQEVDIYDGIDMKVMSVSNKSLTIKITNNTESDIYYDMVYEIQKNINGKWYKYLNENDFIESIETIKSNSYANLDIIYSTVYNLDRGKYRIIKIINSKILSAEFEI